MNSVATPAEFLSALFAHALGENPQLRGLVYTLPDRVSAWCAAPEEMAAAAAARQERYDVFFGLGLFGAGLSAKQKGKQEEVAGITSLWLDLDFAGKKTGKRYVPDLEAGIRLLAMMPLPPSIVVHSGGGLHVYWLLAEPWIFDGDAKRAEAHSLSQRWQALAKQMAAKGGHDIDSVHNLDRVLRVPGSTNHKHASKPTVAILDFQPERRYSADDFEQYLPAMVAAAAGAAAAPAHLEAANPDRAPMLKLAELWAAEPMALAAFLRTRDDMKDRSPSACDQSLANYMALAGFGDQEIADTCAAARKRAADGMKHPAYYRLTAQKAKDTLARPAAIEALADMEPPAKGEAVSADRRESLLSKISTAVGCRIDGVTKLANGSRPHYTIHTPTGDVDLKGVGELIEQRPFRAALASANGHLMFGMKEREWDAIARHLLGVCEVKEVGPEGNDVGVMRQTVQGYLERQNVSPEKTDEAIAGARPFVHGGSVYFTLTEVRRWAFQKWGDKLPVTTAAGWLRQMGAKPILLEGAKAAGKRSPRRYWHVAPDDLGVDLASILGGASVSSAGDDEEELP